MRMLDPLRHHRQTEAAALCVLVCLREQTGVSHSPDM